jgi:predicted PurR-regulated permease PerM
MAEPVVVAAPSLLTDRQRKLVGFALGLFALLATVALLAFVFWVLSQLVGYFSGVLWPLAVAGILALILRPVVEVLQRRMGGRRRVLAVILLYGAFLLAVAAFLVTITPPIVQQIIDFIAFVPTFWARLIERLQQHYPQWLALAQHQLENPTVRNLVDGLLAEAQVLVRQAMPSIRAAGVGALGVFGFFAHAAVIPIYLFFFLLSRHDPTRNLGAQLPFLQPEAREDVVFLVREFIGIVISFFRGQLLIGLIMGALLAIGFSVVGLRFGLLIGLALGILNIIPYLGTIIGLGVALPLAYLQPGGSWTLVGLVLLVFVIVQNIEGWYLTPKIMGDRTGLHPVAVIIAIFFWGTALDGILGMILAIPLTAFFVTAWRLAKRKYLRPA